MPGSAATSATTIKSLYQGNLAHFFSLLAPPAAGDAVWSREVFLNNRSPSNQIFRFWIRNLKIWIHATARTSGTVFFCARGLAALSDFFSRGCQIFSIVRHLLIYKIHYRAPRASQSSLNRLASVSPLPILRETRVNVEDVLSLLSVSKQ